MIKVVLDTNVIISGVIMDRGTTYNNVFREFVTWQEIDKIITGVESNLTNSDKEKISGISTKIKYTLAHVRK